MIELSHTLVSGQLTVFGRITDTVVPPTWDPQSPGDVVLGFAGYIFHVKLTGGTQLSNAVLLGPVNSVSGGFSMTQVRRISSSLWMIGALQPTFFGNPSYVIQGVGLESGYSWVHPAALFGCKLTGGTGCQVECRQSTTGRNNISILYGAPGNWNNAAKVDSCVLGDPPNYVVSLP